MTSKAKHIPVQRNVESKNLKEKNDEKKSRWHMTENPNPCHKNSESSVQKNSRFTRRHKIHSHGKMAAFKEKPEIQPQPTLEKPFVTRSEPVIHTSDEIPTMRQRTFTFTPKKTAIEKLKDAGHRLVAFIQHIFQHKGR